MANVLPVSFTKFITEYAIKNGEIATEYNQNLSPLRLKKELNYLYNVIQLLNGNDMDVLPWSDIEYYIVDDIVQNIAFDGHIYRARRTSTNVRPDTSIGTDWEKVEAKDYTTIGDFSNFLAKDNMVAFTPTDEYNPSTKKYVDTGISSCYQRGEIVADSEKLNGEVVENTLSTKMYTPASVNLVKLVDDKANTKLDATEFNSTNVTAMVQNVDGAGTGLDADLLDGQSSETFMKVGSTSNLNTLFRQGTYLSSVGNTGNPTGTGTYAITVSGNNSMFAQLAMDVSLNKIYFRSYVSGSWKPWKQFADASGSIAEAEKLVTPRNISISGDASGSISFDGSANVDIPLVIANDSHNHDGRYFTETESDNRFLGLHAKSDDSNKLDGINSTQFIRKDIGGTNIGNHTWSDTATFNSNVTMDGTLHVEGDLTVFGTTTTIDSENVSITDHNIILGAADLPTNITADGGGITLLGTTEKSIKWLNSTNKWTFSDGIQAPTFTGTSSNADKLDNLNSTQFLRSDVNDSMNGKLTISKNVGTAPTYSTGQMELKNTDAGDVSLGFHRSGHTACQLRHESNGLILSGTTPTASADMKVTGKFIGTATSAQYADLAERYESDKDYKPGTVLEIGGDKEVTLYNGGSLAGVVSTLPGLMLNSETKGLYVALKGKVPCRISGTAKKGDYIIAIGNGFGSAVEKNYAMKHHLDIIGISLEDGENLIEVKI